MSKVETAGTTVTLTLSGDLVEPTIAPATTLSQFDTAVGWTDVDLNNGLDYTASTSTHPATLDVTLPAAPSDVPLVPAGARWHRPHARRRARRRAPAPLAGGTDLAFTIGASS